MIPLGILASDPYLKDAETLAPLRAGYEVHDFGDWQTFDAATLLAKCRSVEVIVTGRQSPKLPPELAAAHPPMLKPAGTLRNTT